MLPRSWNIVLCAAAVLTSTALLSSCGTGATQAAMAAGEEPSVTSESDPGIPFWADEAEETGGDAVVDAAPAKKPPATAGPAGDHEKDQKPRQVTISGKNNLGSVVYGESVSFTFTAKHGTGAYAWKADGLPEGLSLEELSNGKKAKISGAPSGRLGEYEISLRAADAKDPENAGEKKVKLTVEDTATINLYSLGTGDEAWELIEPPTNSAVYGEIVIPPGGVIMAEILGHSESYAWSLKGQPATCDENGICEAAIDGIILTNRAEGMPDAAEAPGDENVESGTPLQREVMYLKASGEVIGKAIEGIVIAVKDNAGNNIANAEIVSVLFEDAPCHTPLSVSGRTGSEVSINHRNFTYDKPLTITMAVDGAVGAVSWTETEESKIARETYGLAFSVEGRMGKLTGTIHPVEGISIEEYKAGLEFSLAYAVGDECPGRTPVHVTLNIAVKANEDILAFSPAAAVQRLIIGANDTDGSTTIRAALLDVASGEIAAWKEPLGLDPYGDESDCDSWEDCEDLEMKNFPETPAFVASGDVPATVEGVAQVEFATTDPGSGGALDVKVHEYVIRVPYWRGVAVGTGDTHDDVGEGRFSYAIAWVYDCTTGYEGEDPCQPEAERPTGQEDGKGLNRHIKSHVKNAVLHGLSPQAGLTTASASATKDITKELDVYPEETAAIVDVVTVVASGGVSAVADEVSSWFDW